jgi:hypothetical protein
MPTKGRNEESYLETARTLRNMNRAVKKGYDISKKLGDKL